MVNVILQPNVKYLIIKLMNELIRYQNYWNTFDINLYFKYLEAKLAKEGIVSIKK